MPRILWPVGQANYQIQHGHWDEGSSVLIQLHLVYFQLRKAEKVNKNLFENFLQWLKILELHVWDEGW